MENIEKAKAPKILDHAELVGVYEGWTDEQHEVFFVYVVSFSQKNFVCSYDVEKPIEKTFSVNKDEAVSEAKTYLTTIGRTMELGLDKLSKREIRSLMSLVTVTKSYAEQERFRKENRPTDEEKELAKTNVLHIITNLITSDKKDFASAKVLADIYGISDDEFNQLVIKEITDGVTFFPY